MYIYIHVCVNCFRRDKREGVNKKYPMKIGELRRCRLQSAMKNKRRQTVLVYSLHLVQMVFLLRTSAMKRLGIRILTCGGQLRAGPKASPLLPCAGEGSRGRRPRTLHSAFYHCENVPLHLSFQAPLKCTKTLRFEEDPVKIRHAYPRLRESPCEIALVILHSTYNISIHSLYIKS